MNYKNLFLSFLISCLLVFIVPCMSTSSQQKSSDPILYMLASEGEAQMLSSVIVTPENKIIVIDGGWTYDAERLISTVKKYGNRIDAWFITHPDPDHSGALYRVLQGGYGVGIGTIYYSFATDDWYAENSPDIDDFVKLLKNTLQKYNTHETRKNDIYHIGSAKIYVLNDRYTFSQNPVNNSSIVYKIFINDTSILYLGDLGYEGGEKLLAETPPYLLSSNIVQMAHHGQAGVGEDVYKAIRPKIALWSTPQWLWTNQNGTGHFKTLETRQWIQKIGSKNYVTADGDICLGLN